MQLAINVKHIARKQPLIDKKIIEIEDIGISPEASALIVAVVHQQVAEYNSKPKEKNLLPFLSDKETSEQIASGKIGFGSIYNENLGDSQKSANAALQAFEDGMFAMFVNDREVTKLDQIITINNNTTITFIRLTFLAGSYW